LSKLLFSEYDICRRAQFRAELDAAADEKQLVLDFTDVRYIECACIGILIQRIEQWRMQTPDFRVSLCNASSMLVRMLDILQLRHFFNFEFSTTAQPA
jgi:anti-anti-sigma factor